MMKWWNRIYWPLLVLFFELSHPVLLPTTKRGLKVWFLFIVVIFPIEKSTQSTCKGKQYFLISWPELFIFEDLVFMPRSQINRALDFTLNICRDNFTNFYEHRDRYSGGGRVYIVQLQGMMSRSSHWIYFFQPLWAQRISYSETLTLLPGAVSCGH